MTCKSSILLCRVGSVGDDVWWARFEDAERSSSAIGKARDVDTGEGNMWCLPVCVCVYVCVCMFSFGVDLKRK